MNGHEVRHAQIFRAVSEAILKTYGFVPLSVREDAAAYAVTQVILEQAYAEKFLRDDATKIGYSQRLVDDMIEQLHAPLGAA